MQIFCDFRYLKICFFPIQQKYSPSFNLKVQFSFFHLFFQNAYLKNSHQILNHYIYIYIYIYIYAFSRRFYPKRLTLHFKLQFYILSAHAFPGNRTHDLGVASAMLYHLSYRKAVYIYIYIYLLLFFGLNT